MRVVQILLVALVLFVFVELAVVRKDNEIACHCAVFGEMSNAQMTMDDDPLLEKSVNIEAECDENGAKNCGALCKALGEAGAAQESQELCEAIINTNVPLRPTFYSMICNATAWTYTGLTAGNDYCCAEGEHAICNATTADYDYDEYDDYIDWRMPF